MTTIPPRYNVLGTAISALSLDQATQLILATRGQPRTGHVCCATAYNVNLAHTDATLRKAYNRSFLTTPDGVPLVWLGRWLGHSTMTRVYGPDLLLAVCDAGRAIGLKHYFYGGAPGVAAELARRLSTRSPGLQVAGIHAPPFRPPTGTEIEELRADIAAKRPDIVWIGLSSPKQEKFMLEHAAAFDSSLLIGIGAAFDFHSGRVRQAPRWMQRSGLEWLHRLGTEPRRLWPRYLVHNPLFVLRTIAQLAGLAKYPIETDSSEK